MAVAVAIDAFARFLMVAGESEVVWVPPEADIATLDREAKISLGIDGMLPTPHHSHPRIAVSFRSMVDH